LTPGVGPPGASSIAVAAARTQPGAICSKQALVAQLNDMIDTEAGVWAIATQSARSIDPAEIVATPARITRSILEHSGDVVRALVTGAAAEPELGAVLTEGQRRHSAGAASVVAALEGLDALNPSIDRDEAVDTLAAISDFRLALVLNESYGWSLDKLEAWIADTSRALLLR
jgi:hypothetical protein